MLTKKRKNKEQSELGWNNSITAKRNQYKCYMVSQYRITKRPRKLTIYKKKIFASGMKRSAKKGEKDTTKYKRKNQHKFYMASNTNNKRQTKKLTGAIR